MVTFDERRDRVAAALVKRTKAKQDRAQALATSYLEAALERAEAVTCDVSPPPTAHRSAQIGLILAFLNKLKDVPAVEELAALLRITRSAASTLLSEVLATSDNAFDWSAASVFDRASSKTAGTGAPAKTKLWTFNTLSDLQVARDYLEFERVEYKTQSSTDGQFRLFIADTFKKPKKA